MTVVFTKYKSEELKNYEKQFIEYILKHELSFNNSYYTLIQRLYNNQDHHSTIQKNFCKLEKIRKLSQYAKSPNHIITVEGNVHTNHHVSNIVMNAYTNQPIFVKDTYIRIRMDGSDIEHILVKPPIISSNIPYYINYSMHCDKVNVDQIIYPIIEFGDIGTYQYNLYPF